MRRPICLVLLVSVSALSVAASAYAEGGASIAAAPAIVPGQQEFGNTTRGSKGGSTLCTPAYQQFWTLAVTAGDAITIDWESHGGGTILGLLPIGTTDFNVNRTSQVVSQKPGGNDKNELMYTANATGIMPLNVEDQGTDCEGYSGPGPYSFTVYITHALDVALPHIGALHSSGELTIGVHNPEGGAIANPAVAVEVQIKGQGGWQTIGVASVAGSAAAVHFKVPSYLRHQRVAMRALAHGSGYASATSAHLKVRTL
jgi:hypothetical protein